MYKKLENFQKSGLWRGFDKINSFFISLSAAALTLMVFATVISRYCFKKDIFGSEEVILLFAWWMYFLGGITGSQEDSHIKADLIDVFCKNQYIVDMTKGIAKALEFVIFSLCTYMTILLLQTNMVKMPRTTGLKIPYLASQIPIAIGFFGMALFALYWALYFMARAGERRKGGYEEK